MGGKYSRDKGKRNEYLARDVLRAEGYTADRVPSSGAAQGFKGDIKFSKDGRDYLAEVKSRTKDTYKHIYNYYEEHNIDGTIGIYDNEAGAISVSNTAQGALAKALYFVPGSRSEKAVKQLVKIKEFVKDCNILIIREDNKPFIFITYS